MAALVVKIALLGAESTGKSELAHAMAGHLQMDGSQAVAVDEFLREWCAGKGRTPQRHEQAEIALTQRLRIEQASRELAASAKPGQASYVIADTTPLMTAIYSEFIFQDSSLTQAALAYQHSFQITLLTGLDMPWEADGIQRDGAHVRAPVDAALRDILHAATIDFEVIYGLGEQRLQAAIQALNAMHSIAPHAENTRVNALKIPENNMAMTPQPWIWTCDKCSDPDCEHRLFTRLRSKAIG
jgi:nicotinamide riboside kinase